MIQLKNLDAIGPSQLEFFNTQLPAVDKKVIGSSAANSNI